MAACPVPDCSRPVYARGHCSRHYRQLLRHGQVQPDRVVADCAVPSCGRRAVTRGWCHGHYLRVQRTGDLRADVPLRRPADDTCRVEGCGKGAHSAGWCRAHARRVRLHGSPDGGRPERQRTPEGGSLSHGYWSVPVQPEDRHLVPGRRTTELEHRLVLARALGRPLTADETVHHLNGDRLDNRLENLELWSSAQPSGQRVADTLRWAYQLIATYDTDAAEVLGLLEAPGQTSGPPLEERQAGTSS